MQKRNPGRLGRRGGTTRCLVGEGTVYPPRFGRPLKYPALVWWHQVLVQLRADDALFYGGWNCSKLQRLHVPLVLHPRSGGRLAVRTTPKKGLGGIRTAQYEVGFMFLPGTETLHS